MNKYVVVFYYFQTTTITIIEKLLLKILKTNKNSFIYVYYRLYLQELKENGLNTNNKSSDHNTFYSQNTTTEAAVVGLM